MTVHKLKQPDLVISRVSKEIDDSRIIPSILGKKVLFVTDDRDISSERLITPFILSAVGANQSSGGITYSTFFSEVVKADVIILRSSRFFSQNTDTLISSLKTFRRENPDASIVVCAFDGTVFAKLQELKENQTINYLTANPPSDLDLVKLGAQFLAKSRSF